MNWVSCDEGNFDVIIPSSSNVDTPRAALRVGVETDLVTWSTTHLRRLCERRGVAADSAIETVDNILEGNDDVTIPLDNCVGDDDVGPSQCGRQVVLPQMSLFIRIRSTSGCTLSEVNPSCAPHMRKRPCVWYSSSYAGI